MVSVSASLLLLASAVAVILPAGEGFPDGAPIEACILPNPNRPNHPATKSQSPSSSKHSFTASGSHYRPGDIITVIISGPPFKGFFVQGRDSHTNDWVGSFDETPETKVYPECSAATHNTVPPKTSVKLVWHAPRDRSGTVYFTGTILERYDRYWSDMVAKVIKPQF
ncbi:ferric-chelate reductase 1-like [Macrobrachium rosenbergii]|uniref:ferric-chelate reductase 1-like n=1 Tax=Macrobrachium rosenbergii TaxID=79674 RepID=UPI0034D52F45